MPKQTERLSDERSRIDVAKDAYDDLLRLTEESPGKKARISIAGYG